MFLSPSNLNCNIALLISIIISMLPPPSSSSSSRSWSSVWTPLPLFQTRNHYHHHHHHQNHSNKTLTHCLPLEDLFLWEMEGTEETSKKSDDHLEELNRHRTEVLISGRFQVNGNPLLGLVKFWNFCRQATTSKLLFACFSWNTSQCEAKLRKTRHNK